jgi:hypothetical protein
LEERVLCKHEVAGSIPAGSINGRLDPDALSCRPMEARILEHAQAGEGEAEAVRWLRRSYRAGALVDALAAIGMAVPRLYGPTLRFDRGFRRESPEFAYAMRVGAPLMAGWTLLLLWADRRPIERRGVLPITVAPVIAGLMVNDAHAVRVGRLSGASLAPVRALQLTLAALFTYSAFKARIAVGHAR